MRTYVLIVVMIALLTSCQNVQPDSTTATTVVLDDVCGGQTVPEALPLDQPVTGQVTTQDDYRHMPPNMIFTIIFYGEYVNGKPVYDVIMQTINIEFCSAWATPGDPLWEGDIPPANSKRIVRKLPLQGGEYFLECWNQAGEIRRRVVVNPPGT